MTVSLSGSGPFRSEIVAGTPSPQGFGTFGQPTFFNLRSGTPLIQRRPPSGIEIKMSTFLDPAFPLNQTWQIVMQAFSPAATSGPMFALEPGSTDFGKNGANWTLVLNPNSFNGLGLQNIDLGVVTRGAWDDWTIRLLLADTKNRSLIYVQRNGSVAYAETVPIIPTSFTPPYDDWYLKCGLYRDVAITSAAQVWIDNVSISRYTN
jgi:hypothetical protein